MCYMLTEGVFWCYRGHILLRSMISPPLVTECVFIAPPIYFVHTATTAYYVMFYSIWIYPNFCSCMYPELANFKCLFLRNSFRTEQFTSDTSSPLDQLVSPLPEPSQLLLNLQQFSITALGKAS